jgi:hypothetical protein
MQLQEKAVPHWGQVLLLLVGVEDEDKGDAVWQDGGRLVGSAIGLMVCAQK